VSQKNRSNFGDLYLPEFWIKIAEFDAKQNNSKNLRPCHVRFVSSCFINTCTLLATNETAACFPRYIVGGFEKSRLHKVVAVEIVGLV